MAEEGSKLDRSTTKSYGLVASPSGKELYVDTPEYDPLAKHRPAESKGEGLGFLWSIFPCCWSREAVKAINANPQEPAATAERHYSLPPSSSTGDVTAAKA